MRELGVISETETRWKVLAMCCCSMHRISASSRRHLGVISASSRRHLGVISASWKVLAMYCAGAMISVEDSKYGVLQANLGDDRRSRSRRDLGV